MNIWDLTFSEGLHKNDQPIDVNKDHNVQEEIRVHCVEIFCAKV